MNEIIATYAYAHEVAEQMSLVGVFLGGVTITILITLVILKNAGKLVNWMVGISALGGCCFLISVVSSLRLIIALHPEFPSPETTNSQEINLLWKSMVASYGIGVTCLVANIGASGWLRSRSTGVFTTLLAIITAFFFVMTSIFE